MWKPLRSCSRKPPAYVLPLPGPVRSRSCPNIQNTSCAPVHPSFNVLMACTRRSLVKTCMNHAMCELKLCDSISMHPLGSCSPTAVTTIALQNAKPMHGDVTKNSSRPRPRHTKQCGSMKALLRRSHSCSWPQCWRGRALAVCIGCVRDALRPVRAASLQPAIVQNLQNGERQQQGLKGVLGRD